MRTKRLTSLCADAFLDRVCPDESLCSGALSSFFNSASESSDVSRSCAEEVKLHSGRPEGGHIQKGQSSFTDGSTSSAAGARPVKSLGHFRMAFCRCVRLIECLHVRYHDKSHVQCACVRACRGMAVEKKYCVTTKICPSGTSSPCLYDSFLQIFSKSISF